MREEKGSLGRLGIPFWTSRDTIGRRHAAAKPVNGGHVHGQVSPVEAFHRARGGQQCGQGGTPFWATSRPN